MPGAGPDAFAHPLLDRASDAPASSRKATCCSQGIPTITYRSCREGEVEEPARRHRVGPDGVQPRCGHLLEVALDGELVAVLAARLVRPERAVRDAADVELAVARVEELPAHLGPRHCDEAAWDVSVAIRDGSGSSLGCGVATAAGLPPQDDDDVRDSAAVAARHEDRLADGDVPDQAGDVLDHRRLAHEPVRHDATVGVPDSNRPGRDGPDLRQAALRLAATASLGPGRGCITELRPRHGRCALG